MWGIETLVKKLQALQGRQVDESMSPLCAELRSQVVQTESMLEAMPAALETVEQRRWRLLEVVQSCATQFHELITATDTTAASELHLAARSHDLCGAFVTQVSERLPNFLSDESLCLLSEQVDRHPYAFGAKIFLVPSKKQSRAERLGARSYSQSSILVALGL